MTVLKDFGSEEKRKYIPLLKLGLIECLVKSGNPKRFWDSLRARRQNSLPKQVGEVDKADEHGIITR